ncbi:hypothetical protein OROGR_029323 [Orobanche gracilis]
MSLFDPSFDFIFIITCRVQSQIFISQISSSVFSTHNTSVNLTPNPERYTQKSPASSRVPNETPHKQEDIKADDAIASQDPNPGNTFKEPEKYNNRQCDTSQALLRVYIYDLPPEFHFRLLGWKGSARQTWPNVNYPDQIPSYPGGLNLQHSTEYWLTLDLLASNTENVVRPCSAIRVMNSSEADIVFVPFFSSLSYNFYSKRHRREKAGGDKMLQEKLVEFLIGRKEWKKSGGRDHMCVAHHPNNMLYARQQLGSCMFVLSDFGRYSAKIANLQKDVIAPYKHIVRTISDADSSLLMNG